MNCGISALTKWFCCLDCQCLPSSTKSSLWPSRLSMLWLPNYLFYFISISIFYVCLFVYFNSFCPLTLYIEILPIFQDLLEILHFPWNLLQFLLINYDSFLLYSNWCWPRSENESIAWVGPRSLYSESCFLHNRKIIFHFLIVATNFWAQTCTRYYVKHMHILCVWVCMHM